MTEQLDDHDEKLEAGQRGKQLTGRPRKDITPEAVKGLAAIFATYDEMAAYFECSSRTIKRRMKEPAFKQARLEGEGLARISLRRLQWRHARGSGSSAVSMTIHLSQHHLGQTAKAALELSGKVDGDVTVTTSARERVTTKVEQLAQRIARGAPGVLAAGGTPAVLREPV
jgi:hypothetical protein